MLAAGCQAFLTASEPRRHAALALPGCCSRNTAAALHASLPFCTAGCVNRSCIPRKTFPKDLFKSGHQVALFGSILPPGTPSCFLFGPFAHLPHQQWVLHCKRASTPLELKFWREAMSTCTSVPTRRQRLQLAREIQAESCLRLSWRSGVITGNKKLSTFKCQAVFI